MNTTHYLGFHGSDFLGTELICSGNTFLVSHDEEEWLGNGIYFFENDFRQAEFFCTIVRRYSQWGVVKSEIEATDVIDLLLHDHLVKFEEFAKKLKNRYIKRKDGTKRKLINAIVLNTMYTLSRYDMVRCAFEATYIRMDLERTNIKPMQIQLCVKNKECIKSIERVR